MSTGFQFNIEKGLPVPPPRSSYKWDGLADVMRKMEVGDSILMPRQSKSNPAVNIRDCAKKVGITVAVRTLSETEVRFWRVG